MFNEIKETDGMRLLTILAALLAAFAVGGGLALATGDGSSSGTDLTGSTTEIGTTIGDEAGDISGPCDEAEHANDPRCTGVTVPGADDDDNRDDDGPGDISGPCDEAEHANDPRCAGAGPVDSSGPGPGGRDDHEDNSGPGNGDEDNSGPSDNSGPGSGGDDDDDDNSGPGSGGSGSGSSGSG
jgi:hypothetical protein